MNSLSHVANWILAAYELTQQKSRNNFFFLNLFRTGSKTWKFYHLVIFFLPEWNKHPLIQKAIKHHIFCYESTCIYKLNINQRVKSAYCIGTCRY